MNIVRVDCPTNRLDVVFIYTHFYEYMHYIQCVLFNSCYWTILSEVLAISISRMTAARFKQIMLKLRRVFILNSVSHSNDIVFELYKTT